jgi:gas vesicle protein
MCTKSSNSLLATIGFVGLGVAIGLLVAPQKGSDTRQMITDKGRDCLDQLSDLIRPKDKVERVAETVEEESEGLLDDAGKRFGRMVDEATS